jgi:hypothetical protein
MPPPASTDIDGWRDAIADGSITSLRFEALAAALQDLGPSVNHPNRWDDIIYRIHGQVFEASLQPNAADGRAFRAGFASIVSFRRRARRGPASAPRDVRSVCEACCPGTGTPNTSTSSPPERVVRRRLHSSTDPSAPMNPSAVLAGRVCRWRHSRGSSSSLDAFFELAHNQSANKG